MAEGGEEQTGLEAPLLTAGMLGTKPCKKASCPHQEQQVPSSSHGQGIWEITWQNPKTKARLEQALKVVSAHSPKGGFVRDASAARWGM